MRIDILTVFPDMIACALDHSIVKRARERGLITINVVNLRDFTTDRHKTTDDLPYGGGGGMVMKIDPIARALASLLPPSVHNALASAIPTASHPAADKPPPYAANVPIQADFETFPTQTAVNEVNYTVSSEEIGSSEAIVSGIGSRLRPRIALTDPRGPQFTQVIARQWARDEHLILLCGHYEGVDERVRQHLVTDEISIGDYILTGGELPALIITDALTRLQPDALGDEQAPDKDTFEGDLLEYPHYTRPREFNGWAAPDILLCGHHAQIERWRRWHQLQSTRVRRPDLFARLDLSKQDLKLLNAEEPTAPPDSKAAAHKLPAPGTARQEQAEPDELRPAPRQPARYAETVEDASVTRQDVSVADATVPPRTTHYTEQEETDGTGT
jgi:tRNA (guanine37-N1)-methyltransferase